jgi:hypothetical protein
MPDSRSRARERDDAHSVTPTAMPRQTFPFSEISRAGFTEGLESVGLGLLGQTGFFDQFTVTFNHRAGVFHVE